VVGRAGGLHRELARDARQVRSGRRARLPRCGDYFERVVARRRDAPADDLVTALLVTGERGERLGEAELIASCVLLLFRGSRDDDEPRRNGALALLRHPAEARAWRENSALGSSAVEELLRYDGPTPAMVRVAREDLRIGDKDIGRGDRLFLMINAANRDPPSSGAGPARPRARGQPPPRVRSRHPLLPGRAAGAARGAARAAGAAGALPGPPSTGQRAGVARLARIPRNALVARRAGVKRAATGETPMPRVSANGIRLHYEETGAGVPLVFVHEFAGDAQSWHLQVRFFARRYRTNRLQRSRLPAVGRADRLGARTRRTTPSRTSGPARRRSGSTGRTSAGCRMGGYATLHFGLRHPERALSLVVAGCGYGSVAADRAQFQRDVAATAERFLTEPMATLADVYCAGPTRVQFRDKDPKGWQEFHDQFAAQSALGHGLTMRGSSSPGPACTSSRRSSSASRCRPSSSPATRTSLPRARDLPEAEDPHVRPGGHPPRRGTRSTSRSPRRSTGRSWTSSPPWRRGGGAPVIPRLRRDPPSSRQSKTDRRS
jgi:hypothetical protein